jgi:hypothetical protein
MPFVPKHEQSPIFCAKYIPPHHPHIEGFRIQPGRIYLHLIQGGCIEMGSAPIPVVNLCIQCATYIQYHIHRTPISSSSVSSTTNGLYGLVALLLSVTIILFFLQIDRLKTGKIEALGCLTRIKTFYRHFEAN